MANKKITELPELTEVAADDYLEIVDTSTNTNKKISRETLTNRDSDYLGITAKAADSDKLDGLDSTAFLQTTSWQEWSPTLTGWSSTTTLICKYLKMGKILFFSAIISGTSNDYSASFTLPETSANITEYTGTMGYCIDNGSPLTVAARYGIAQGSNICKAYTNMEAGPWTASGTKMVSVYGWIATD